MTALFALMIVCQEGKNAEQQSVLQVDGDVTYMDQHLYFDDTKGNRWDVDPGSGLLCVIDEGEVPPPGADLRGDDSYISEDEK